MAIDFRSGAVHFDSTAHRIQEETTSVVFNSTVRRADVALNGFNAKYTNGDRGLFHMIVDTSIASIRDRTVDVKVTYLLRDSSGNIDDPYEGHIAVLVIAEVA